MNQPPNNRHNFLAAMLVYACLLPLVLGLGFGLAWWNRPHQSVRDTNPRPQPQPKEWPQTCEMCGAEWLVTPHNPNDTVPPTVKWCFNDGAYCEIGFQLIRKQNHVLVAELQEVKRQFLNHCLTCQGCRCAAFEPEQWEEVTKATTSFPTTPADAAALKAHDVHWTNHAIRQHYLKLLNDESLEFQARRAYVVRHNARLTCRAMMEEAAEVEALRARDLEKYGSPDGPTFDWLVRQHRMRGKCGDEVFQAILESATETDPEVNSQFQPEPAAAQP